MDIRIDQVLLSDGSKVYNLNIITGTWGGDEEVTELHCTDYKSAEALRDALLQYTTDFEDKPNYTSF